MSDKCYLHITRLPRCWFRWQILCQLVELRVLLLRFEQQMVNGRRWRKIYLPVWTQYYCTVIRNENTSQKIVRVRIWYPQETDIVSRMVGTVWPWVQFRPHFSCHPVEMSETANLSSRYPEQGITSSLGQTKYLITFQYINFQLVMQFPY
jgi:hypothetical protein